MRFVRLAMCVAAFAVVGGVVLSEDIDVRSLQQKLAAQEARLNDLQAKVNSGAYASGSDVEGLVSINKNAVVTVGGQVNTRYFYRTGKVTGGDVVPIAGGDSIGKVWMGGASPNSKPKYSQGDLKVSDAKLRIKADVNEYFDAYLQVDLQSSNDASGSDNAEIYYVRWKNVCNSGFGLKVGRDVLTFGEGTPIGVLATYAAGGGDGVAGAYWTGNSMLPHNNWDEGRYTQITPYWESQDGKFGFELSLYQDYAQHSKYNGDGGGDEWDHLGGSIYGDGNWAETMTSKSRNYGFGSMSARFRFRPIEGLLLSASVMNFRDNAANTSNAGVNKYVAQGIDTTAKNNTAIDLAFSYRPVAFNRLNVWGQWIHGWNVDNYDDLDSDAVNLGVSFDLNESWTIFAMGDYLKTNGHGRVVNDYFYSKGVAWASYVGVKYVLPYGVSLEAGWKHEQIKLKNNIQTLNETHKVKDMKIKGDTIYAHLGFDF